MGQYDDEATIPLFSQVDDPEAASAMAFPRKRRPSPGMPWYRLRRLSLFVISGCFLFWLGLLAHSRTGVLPFDKHEVTEFRETEGQKRALQIRVFNELLQQYYPATGLESARSLNYEALDKLATCLENDTCGEAQEKVILFASFHFGNYHIDAVSGEDIWAGSMIRIYESMGYTLLYSWNHVEALFIYQHMADMVPVVIWEGDTLTRCIKRNETNYIQLEQEESMSQPNLGGWQTGAKRCMYADDFPQGIPWYKSFAFHFWADSKTPWLGSEWTLAPESYEWVTYHPNNQYIGYTLEDRCKTAPHFTQREHRALVLGKDPAYFTEDKSAFFGLLKPAADAMPHDDTGESFHIISTAGDKGEDIAEPGVTTLGMLSQDEWLMTLARSKALVGIGHPPLSPSPFDALCSGIPFINPVLNWDKNDPDNKAKWERQQDALMYEQEPYVYHVFKDDAEGLQRALRLAAENPIEPYIPLHMREDQVRERQRKLAETDWHAKAVERIKQLYPGDDSKLYLARPAPDVGVPVFSGQH